MQVTFSYSQANELAKALTSTLSVAAQLLGADAAAWRYGVDTSGDCDYITLAPPEHC